MIFIVFLKAFFGEHELEEVRLRPILRERIICNRVKSRLQSWKETGFFYDSLWQRHFIIECFVQKIFLGEVQKSGSILILIFEGRHYIIMVLHIFENLVEVDSGCPDVDLVRKH